jgi:hypothetical protein
VVSGGASSTTALAGSTEAAQFQAGENGHGAQEVVAPGCEGQSSRIDRVL